MQRWLDLIYPGELFTAQPEYRERWQAVQRRLFMRDLAYGIAISLLALVVAVLLF